MKIITAITIVSAAIAISIGGCASEKLAQREGIQLWTENCVRCHSTPPADAFTAQQWGTITMHMRVRAGLADDEIKKITEFLQSSSE